MFFITVSDITLPSSVNCIVKFVVPACGTITAPSPLFCWACCVGEFIAFEAVFINAPQMIFGRFENVLRNKAPQYPVVKSDVIPDEVYRAVESIIDTGQNDIWVVQAYLQIILARCIPMMKLVEKSKIGSDDIIYRTVSYISANFNKSISLDGMAHDLGVSKFSLSRLFSKTFHSSFNQYVNEARLGYACQRIETTDDTLTEISMDSGFGSLRTFNRVFKEKYRLTPSEYRNKLQI